MTPFDWLRECCEVGMAMSQVMTRLARSSDELDRQAARLLNERWDRLWEARAAASADPAAGDG